MITWWPLIKKFGPYLGIIVLIVGIWLHGKSVGSAKYKAEVTSHNVTKTELSRCSDEVEALTGAIDSQNEAIALAASEYDNRVKATQEAAQRVLAEQASSYRRQLQNASEAASSLRERVRTIEQGEACHQAWLEVLR